MFTMKKNGWFMRWCLQTHLLLLVSSVCAIDYRGPRDRFWRHHGEQKTLVYKGVDYYQDLVSCLDRTLTAAEQDEIKTSFAPDRVVGLKLKDDYHGGKVVLVNVERAITPIHVKAVQSLAACVREHLTDFYESRPFYMEMGLEKDPGLGGNNPTHLAPLVGLFFPQVVEEMQRTLQLAYDAAGWDYYSASNARKNHLALDDLLPHPSEIGFRASEHLTYKDFKEGLDDHTDGRDTFYTVNFAFSGPQDYDGGFFFLKYGEGDLYAEGPDPPEQLMLIKPNKYDCLVFLGGPYLHGVTAMTGGNREMFSSELWAYPDTPFGSNLWSNDANRIETHINKCNALFGIGASCDFDIMQHEGKGTFIGTTWEDRKRLASTENSGDYEEEYDDTEQQVESEEMMYGSALEESDYEDLTGRYMTPGRVFNPRDYNEDEFYFLVPRKALLPGEVIPLHWRGDLLLVHKAYLVGLDAPLVPAADSFCETSGLLGTVKTILFDAPVSLDYSMHKLVDGTSWQASRIAPAEESDVVLFEPNDRGAVLPLLRELEEKGNLNSVVHQISLLHGEELFVSKADFLALAFSYDANALPTQDGYTLLIPIRTNSENMFGIGEQRGPEPEPGLDFEWGELALLSSRNIALLLGNETLYAPSDFDVRAAGEFQLFMRLVLEEYRLASPESPRNETNATKHQGASDEGECSSSHLQEVDDYPHSAAASTQDV